MKEEIRKILLETGALAVGFSKAGETDPLVNSQFSDWINQGYHGDMTYLVRHIPLRQNTDSVLPGAMTVVSLSFGYPMNETGNPEFPYISSYAFLDDYHVTLRKHLEKTLDALRKSYGGKWRLCIDSAPVSERYYAIKSGIGRRGLNGCVIVDGAGCFNFLVEILTTIELSPDSSSVLTCCQCGECIKVCPSQALNGDGTMDARRCINYLTIEKKAELSENDKNILKQDKGYMLGCDKCLKVCPHNKIKISNNHSYRKILTENAAVRYLTPTRIIGMEEEEFNQKFADSPLKYVGLPRLKRNARILLDHPEPEG